MLKRQACAKFQSQIFDESEVIQILKVVRWHFCQVYITEMKKKRIVRKYVRMECISSEYLSESSELEYSLQNT